MVHSVVTELEPRVIIETGSHWGTTTRYLAQTTSVPIHSVEHNARSLGFASCHLAPVKGRVSLNLADSRDFLRRLAHDPHVPRALCLFYLDAHWGADLPLGDELQIVFEHWSASVVIIDDFEVPGTDYGFDDYGPGKALNAEYLDANLRTEVFRFYPSAKPEEETGTRRGCIVLCDDPQLAERLAALPELRLS